MNKKKTLRKCMILLFWFAVWHCLAMAVDNRILLVTPAEAFWTLLGILGKDNFLITVGRSLLRIGMGFCMGFVAAVLLAVGGRRCPLLEEVLSPVMNLVKAIPVASFVVLLLIWWGSSFLAVAVCFLVVVPNVYISTLEGLKSTDRQLLEMAQVFQLSFRNRFFYIYRPALKPFLSGSLKVSLGMCWKSGVAAEVIGTPEYSIGEQLYLSKVYLDTAGVFAWTAMIVLLSVCFEKVVLWLVDRFFAWEPACGGRSAARRNRGGIRGEDCPRNNFARDGVIRGPEKDTAGSGGSLRLTDIVKVYHGTVVLDRVSRVYEPGRIYYLTSPSGSGKTTLLRILARLTEPDGGVMEAPPVCSMVFQEDRLCEDYSAVKNVELVTGDRNLAEEALAQLLEREALDKPCRELSGGMKRRVALVRAMESGSDYVLLDEPYTGMDAGTRLRAEEYIRRKQDGRTLIIATHICT